MSLIYVCRKTLHMLLVGLILQINEEPRLNYLIQNLATLYPGMKAVSSNASPD
jgi:hypothetical protein